MTLVIAAGLAAYGFFFYKSYVSCVDIRYITLQPDMTLCTDIYINVNGEFKLDDKGNWETSSSWGFAATMVSGYFNGFTTTTTIWADEYSTTFWTHLKDVSTKYATQPAVYNLLSLVRTWDRSEFSNKCSLTLVRI